jgi:hypothetical protein
LKLFRRGPVSASGVRTCTTIKCGFDFAQANAFLFRIEITIDDDRVALSGTSPAQPRSFAIHYVRSSVHGHTLRRHERQLGCHKEFSLDQLRSVRRAAVRRSTPRARLNLRCASKPLRERKLNARRRRLVKPTAPRVQPL